MSEKQKYKGKSRESQIFTAYVTWNNRAHIVGNYQVRNRELARQKALYDLDLLGLALQVRVFPKSAYENRPYLADALKKSHQQRGMND
ncbi:MAG TPA: hypothetical protein VGK00_03220 [Anaerolineales bacterium]|jgi:hypothetical protein